MGPEAAAAGRTFGHKNFGRVGPGPAFTINLKLPKGLYDSLGEQADMRGVPVQALMREMLRHAAGQGIEPLPVDDRSDAVPAQESVRQRLRRKGK